MKIAAYQFADTQGDMEASIGVIAGELELADKDGIELACFPECFLQGYTREEVRARERALSLTGDPFRIILRRLAHIKTTFILGMIELDGDKLFNTAAVIQNGELLGRYRKMHPNEKIFDAGVEPLVFDVADRKIGVNICNDANYPESALALAEGGAEIIVYPLNNILPNDVAERWRERHIQNLITRAKETKCWVVSSDVVGQSDIAVGYGCTAIVGPDGSVVGRVPELESGVISCIIKP
jgi:predicted amidohydrolase